jgi:hypothetical protein
MTRSEIANNVVGALQASLRKLTAATVVLYIVSVLLAVGAGYTANQNREAACALRADVERRTDEGKKFLIDHPHGLEKLGFSRSDLLLSIHNQERTVDALGSLMCF